MAGAEEGKQNRGGHLSVQVPTLHHRWVKMHPRGPTAARRHLPSFTFTCGFLSPGAVVSKSGESLRVVKTLEHLQRKR